MLNYFKMVDIGIRLGQHFTRNLVGAANELREDEKILSLMHEKLQKEIEALYRSLDQKYRDLGAEG